MFCVYRCMSWIPAEVVSNTRIKYMLDYQGGSCLFANQKLVLSYTPLLNVDLLFLFHATPGILWIGNNKTVTFGKEWREACISLKCTPRPLVCRLYFSGPVLQQRRRLDSLAQALFPAEEACTHAITVKPPNRLEIH